MPNSARCCIVKPSDNHIDRAWADERVEAYADGLLPRRERKVFESMLRSDADLAHQVDLAKQLRQTLSGLPAPACPDAAVEPVLARARREDARERGRVPVSRFGNFRLTPARVLVPATIVLAVVVPLWVIDGERSERPHDPADVQAALEEVKLALSYVSRAGRETGSAIRHMAVDQALIGPVRRAIDRADIGSRKINETGTAASSRESRGTS